jgi:hypothetical protein
MGDHLCCCISLLLCLIGISEAPYISATFLSPTIDRACKLMRMNFEALVISATFLKDNYGIESLSG